MIARKQHVTLSDVAREVGVSRALVGKVLGSCSGNIRVSAETARMIREAAERLHYQPNLSARVLTGQKSGLIGVLIDAQPPAVTFPTLITGRFQGFTSPSIRPSRSVVPS